MGNLGSKLPGEGGNIHGRGWLNIMALGLNQFIRGSGVATMGGGATVCGTDDGCCALLTPNKR